jgi:hypothetical protein
LPIACRPELFYHIHIANALLHSSQPLSLAIRPLPEQILPKDSVLLKANVTKSKFQRLFSEKVG